ncbi:IclR family transcriptional regulator C-terminal domain-containing protein [Pseudolysinimonas yzui]|uniref:Glycerol operon regulatory protein n=1 Tax=Pseudolysinimonas yzui TaxID=2708254 RepID=A0A8J3M3F9_9MICO|nr:IclR family transcriptional regulator C-terminal domain-containing protein [Pseudolysinimonas yzui]GHF22570.1 IclR family transcriptional regulator [Pseudolysinimonas yzui]
MAERTTDPDFVEALARGLSVIRSFEAGPEPMTLVEVANATGLARPTARRMLLTLESLGYVRTLKGGFTLTPRVLELGFTYVQSSGLWGVARPHMEKLVEKTHESSSIAQLDGSDIVYVARVAVPKIIALAVEVGTRFPAAETSLGKVIMSGMDTKELDEILAEPSRSGVTPRVVVDRSELDATLAHIRAKGWALTDGQLAAGIRSIAAPLRNREGRIVAALNVTVNAAETSVETLTEKYLPWLLQAASDISADWAIYLSIPKVSEPATR